MMTRRDVMVAAGIAAASAAAQDNSAARPRNIVMSSANGLQACARAMELLHSGSDTLDAVIGGVKLVELDPNDPSVGCGRSPGW
jgi:N4-(beta-N-acetylglucosaminyl)-L-asparaginase